MTFARIRAFIVVFLFISLWSLGFLLLISYLGAILHHGEATGHASGQIVHFDREARQLTLRNARGDLETFRCEARCLQASEHIQRHLRSQAATDIYYLPGQPHGLPLALDVD